ncbi:hypothetical protein ACHQM5_017622 [Ranunculus cassubicifolius]
MEFERPHRSGGATSSSELFICFTSRPSFSSSASMKASSKSILSPGRIDKYNKEPTLSFSSSMNRRLGSMKAGQSSPMFKKKGGNNGFENAEPSSPKVTCIGQVRVKTKKQGKKMMSLGKRENSSNAQVQEMKVSTEECLPHRNHQKWPIAICEALRGFGSEFTCFLPCGRSCSSRNGRGEKRRTMSSCGAVFAKWLMALQEGEEQEEKNREIRVIVGEDESKGDSFKEIEIGGKGVEYEEGRFSICIPPKNALLLMRCRSEPVKLAALANRFWESPIKVEGDEDSADEGDESGQLSVPWASIEEEILRREWDSVKFVEEQDVLMDEIPLNEQLGSSKDVEEQDVAVMEECPLKEQLSLLAKDLEECPLKEQLCLAKDVGVEEESSPAIEQLDSAEVVEEKSENMSNEDYISLNEQCVSDEVVEEQEEAILEEFPTEEEQLESLIMVDDHENAAKQDEEPISVELSSAQVVEGEEKSVVKEGVFEDDWGLAKLFTEYEISIVESAMVVEEQECLQNEESPLKEQCGSAEIVEGQEYAMRTETLLQEEQNPMCSLQTEELKEVEEAMIEELVDVEEETLVEKIEETMVEEVVVIEEVVKEEALVEKIEETENQKKTDQEEEEKENKALPDCLLMMLCEPKLSMEVSKETWVCSTDYIRRRSQKQVSKINCGDEVCKNRDIRNLGHSQQQNQQASPYPAQSMTSMIEQKLMNAVAYEPFVLTRCKSAPLRSSTKLVPEACFWKNSPVELPPGVGF